MSEIWRELFGPMHGPNGQKGDHQFCKTKFPSWLQFEYNAWALSILSLFFSPKMEGFGFSGIQTLVYPNPKTYIMLTHYEHDCRHPRVRMKSKRTHYQWFLELYPLLLSSSQLFPLGAAFDGVTLVYLVSTWSTSARTREKKIEWWELHVGQLISLLRGVVKCGSYEVSASVYHTL